MRERDRERDRNDREREREKKEREKKVFLRAQSSVNWKMYLQYLSENQI